MSMSMRDTIHNEQAKEDIKALMKSALKKPNAAVGQSGLQVCHFTTVTICFVSWPALRCLRTRKLAKIIFCHLWMFFFIV